MKNYFILSIDSLIDTFSLIDATKPFAFSLKMQSRKDIFSKLHSGDEVLVYRREPVSKINILLEVNDISESSCTFIKRLEVADGVDISNFESVKNLEIAELEEISQEEFQNISNSMINGLLFEEKSPDYKNENRKTKAGNVLLYGVPGVGKSYKIQQEYCNDINRMERVVFHPDYTYSDFVGQILPRLEAEKLKYVFTPGPFTRMLKKAWDNPDKEFFLVIEEINRGNAPAIFGEIFQLLDRKTEDSHKYSPSEYGESEYGISNYEVALSVYGDEKHEVRIPSNMWILATMNTADQNVFTLDTAFQRRWDMRHIKNDILAAGHAHEKIQGTMIEWGAFATVINDMVADTSIDMASFEDKRLGAYFVKRNELTSEKFSEKILKYLWDDVFKMDKESVFDDRFKSLEKVIETYENTSSDKLKAVLRMDVYQKMLNGTEEKTESAVDLLDAE